MKALQDRNSLVRFQAILALGSIGSADAVPGLAPLLRAPDLRTRQLAAQSLAKIGAPAAGALVAALGAKQSATRAAAADGLRELDDDVRTRDDVAKALAGVLDDASPDVRAAAAWALLPDARAVKTLAAVLEKDEVRSAVAAIRALRHSGPRTTDIARRLLAALRSRHETVQWNAASALSAFPAAAVELRKELYPHLRHTRFPVRAAIAAALQPVANQHLGELVGECLAHDDVAPHVALACREQAPAAAARAAAALTHQDPAVARRAAHLLAALGKAGEPHIEALVAATKRDDVPLRVFAARALWPLTRESRHVYPALQAGLSGSKQIRLLSIETLGSMGPAALDAVPMLAIASESKDTQIARAAKAALRRIRK